MLLSREILLVELVKVCITYYGMNTNCHRNFIVENNQLIVAQCNGQIHGLRTPNEGINQRYLKNWADVADKICFGCLGLRLNFRPCSEGYFFSGRP